jgi:hypothetical protein
MPACGKETDGDRRTVRHRVVFHPLPRLETEQVAGVLEDGARRIT